MSKNSKLVYSTDRGRIKNKEDADHLPNPTYVDGIIRVFRETKGRKGAGVSVARGFSEKGAELKALAKELKQHCGTGGTVKDGAIEIQGDHRSKIKIYLEQRGFTVKLAGG